MIPLKWPFDFVIRTALLSFCSFFSYSQNLVPNSGFECFEEEVCTYFTSWNNRAFHLSACGWDIANFGGSPDVFSTKISETCWNKMPTNSYVFEGGSRVIGSQMPRTGNRFAGIFTYSETEGFPLFSYREYLEMELSATLVAGQKYCGEVYVSLAETPQYASNNIGIYISDHKIDYSDLPNNGYRSNGTFIGVEPTIVEKNVIMDTVNWYRIAGVFTAKESDRFIVVGNFQENWQTQVVDKGGYWPDSHDYHTAYYFVDDVSIEPYVEKSLEINGPLSICAGDSLFLKAQGGLLDITWTTLEDTTAVIAEGELFKSKPIETSHLRVKGRNCKNYISDTLTVIVSRRPIQTLGPDTTLCKGTARVLDAGQDGVVYTWQDGSNSQYLTISSPGIFSVKVVNQFGCQKSDTLNVRSIDVPQLNLGPDTLVCAPFDFVAGKEGRQFVWSTGSQDSVIRISDAGTYWVSVTNECGTRGDTVRIYSFDNIFAPNVVTLNGDEFNAHFSVYSEDKTETSPGKLVIYNRLGAFIYSNSNYTDSWPDITSDISYGVYYYKFEPPGCLAIKGVINILK
jgi:hypothetical protein